MKLTTKILAFQRIEVFMRLLLLTSWRFGSHIYCSVCSNGYESVAILILAKPHYLAIVWVLWFHMIVRKYTLGFQTFSLN
uniref:Uncharacterized protein n=1 Tax=Arundo donax TaxID=35708 RepID=A0A0A9AS90_ARUDO